ncbi:MAG: neuraminidase-like domain-containing protein, partial [Wolbachia endosymbiont of Tyrophagus putrescentiae]|nr:neuraminidase-like domain-containing protein [Wolbachia endosymbiont of Tyrophagus putrescentiae]
MNIQGKNITEVFRDEMHEQCDHCQSIFSPAAYLVKLLETIDKYIKPKDALRKRRPDLYELKLDCDHTLKEKPYLEIVCEILEKRLDADNDEDKKLGPWLKSFAISDGLPFFLRGCFPLVAIRTYLKENKTSLEQIYRLCFPEVDLTAESLGLSKEQYALMIDPNQELSDLKKFYGLTSSLSNLNSRKCFLQHTGIKAEELTEFLKAYNTIKKPSKVLFISQSDVIENLDTSALVFLHGFVSLSRALDWSFEALSYIFLALGADKVDAETVKKIANIHWFEKRLQKDLKAAYKTFVVEESLDPSTSLLYLSGTLFEEKVRKLLKGKKNYDEFAGVYIHDIESSDQVGVLQGILYAQSTLARWMGIPIKELIDMMRLLGTENMMNLSKADDVNKLIALHDTLDQYGVNATILSQSMKADDKAIKERYGTQLEELIKAIKNITPWDDLEFSHVLGRYFTLPQDVLVSIVHFSEERVSRYFKKNGDKYKYRNKDMDGLNELLMELIHDIQMLSLLGLRAEDIDHISIYFEKTYDALNGIRSISSIEKILEYKKLKAIFAGHPLSLPRYIDWFYSKEYDQKALIEKISTLSGWDKEVLDLLQADTSFKDCFSEAKDPVKALNKIYSFMDLVSTSGLSAKTLLDLNKLRELPCNTKEAWRMYTKAVSDLELLGVGSDERKENQKKLLERKRDWLCQYMFYKNGTFENMRDLYSELLIDVEMGGCSKISSLKAALNSAQLYLHRCSMRLEEGVRIDPGLSNQTLELLTHYRRWEANQKIQTYPENYLDPTLRKIASPQYKELQNTLMQGHITDESVSEAYLKYFEDFDRLASLEIIDSYFEVVEDPISGGQKDTMFLLGRSITHPYTYHYCTAIFSSKNQKISYWTPWQKIEASIPVDTVTAAYAFGRFFIFWIQKVEKRKARAEKKSDNTAYEDLTTCSIHYVFQRVRNGWSTTQTLADDLEIPHAKKDALCWKKVAIMLFKDKQQEGARHMLVSIGDIGDKENQVQWFLIDEDLVAKKQSHKLSLDRFVGSYRAHPQNLGKIIDDVFLIKNIDFQTFFLKKNRGIAIYDHDQELWEEPLYQTEGSSDVAVAVIKLNENKKAIFFGGKTKINTYSSTIDIYDVSARQWITAVPPNSSLYQASEARSGATVAVVQSKAIFFGGETGANTYSAAIDIYDADRMQWTKAVQPDSSFYQASEARFGAAAAVVQSKAIFFGGKTGANTYSTAIDVYDAEKMQWTKAVQPDNSSYQASEARFGVAAAVVQSKAIFFGGETGANAYSAAIDIYDAEKMQWTKAVQPNSSFYQASEARSDAAVAIVMNAKAIFFGGKTGAGTYSKAIDICDCAEGRWESFQAHEGRFDSR